MMKKIIFLSLLSLLIWNRPTRAQQEDVRTINTRVADLLLKIPATDSLQLQNYMEEIYNMGEEGLLVMANRLSPSGQGDNSRLEYALGGFAFYATQKGREDWKIIGEQAFCQALGNIKDKHNQAFIMAQLEKVGNENAVSCLKEYLTDVSLCDPAARALSNIPSALANKTLVDALKEGQGSCRIPILKALGKNKAQGALDVITPLVDDQDPMVQKAAIFALSQIADPSSEPVLKEAAEQSGFAYDRRDATSAYLDYAENLFEAGNQKLALKISKNLIRNADQDHQVQFRSAALELMVAMKGEESLADLMKALKSDHKAYRVMALNLAGPYLPSTLPNWLKKLKSSDEEVQEEILNMLADNKVKEALPAVIKTIGSHDRAVKLAAISTAAELGDEQLFGFLLQELNQGSPEEVEAVKEALFILPGPYLLEKVAKALPAVPGDAQAALIDVLAHRAAQPYYSTVTPFLKSSESKVRMAALKALSSLSSLDNLPELFTLLKNSAKQEEISLIQEAIIAVLPELKDPSEAVDKVINQLSQSSPAKEMHYYPILASIGGEKVVEKLSGAFWQDKGQTKKAAFDALSSLSDPGVANELSRILHDPAQEDYFDQAFSSYIQVIRQGSYPGEQKLLLLRKAFELAKNNVQKRQVLGGIGDLNTYPSLIFAGKFLEEPPLEKEAAAAVSRIALSNQDFYGIKVREQLEKVQAIQGESAGYQASFLQQHLDDMPSGESFVPLFNGEDLRGWKGLVGNPLERKNMDPETLAKKQALADEEMKKGWKVEDGVLLFTGKGHNLATQKKYGDFELLVDWKIYDDGHKEGDGGIYLRGTPQVQIWDTSRVEVGAQVGSGGLYNNQKHPSKPLKVADNPIGEWNNFHILIKGDTVTVFLNGELVTDKVILENFWDREMALFPSEQIELQAHGSRVAYRDLYIREISNSEPFELSPEEKEGGFKVLFDGTQMDHWTGNTKDYFIENGNLVVRPKEGSGGNLFTKEEYGDFEFRFEFRLTPGANNGLGIRAPYVDGGASYEGMELQILDNTASIYKDLKPYQYHGSAYGILPAERGALKPVGEWNYQEVLVKGPKIKVTLNGKVILDGDLTDARKNGTMDGLEHPGIHREEGHIGFLGHNSEVWFRNIRVKDLDP